MSFIKKNRDVYNAVAPQFSRTRSHLWDDIKPFRQYVNEGDRVLDVGCGNGRLYQLFDGLSISYTGVDQSEALVALAEKKYPSGKFFVSEMTKLPFPEKYFNVVYCIAAFHHLPGDATRLQALSEMKRVLKKGGRVVMMNWNLLKSQEPGARSQEFKKPAHVMVPWKNSKGDVLGERHYWALSPVYLDALFRKVGFVIEEQYYVKRGERSDEREGENLVSVVSVGSETP